MNFLTDWISKIILFMLIGTVIELLLPSNTMKKYVHFIFGLLFLLLLAQPIFFIFQTDITEQIKLIERELYMNDSELNKTKDIIEKQKEDIQAEQAAYIWNELANQYMEQANPKLEEEHEIYISNLLFIENKVLDKEEITVSKIIVSLTSLKDKDRRGMTEIEPIIIGEHVERKEDVFIVNEAVIENTLRDLWQVDTETDIELQWEEGQVD